MKNKFMSHSECLVLYVLFLDTDRAIAFARRGMHVKTLRAR